MCGIAGVVSRRASGAALLQSPRGADTEAIVRAMLAALHHRGPDDRGVFVDAAAGLGHTRLAIIDPVGGVQPMRHRDGHLTMVFNGEIYNYVELRAELIQRGHTFRTRSDTE